MANIIIADPHNLCREALCDYLRHTDTNLSVTGVADCQELYRQTITDKKPDLVIVSEGMPGWERRHLQGAKTGMIVSAIQENMLLDPSLHGLFPKTLSCKSFLAGIHDILAGKNFFPSIEEERSLYTHSSYAQPMPQDFSLTAREKEVLSYLVRGQSNKDIARALDLQVVTIKLHVRGICRKMKVSNRTQAALTAKENGWG